MLASLAENIGDEIGGAVDDEMLFGKVGHGSDEAIELQDPADTAEVSERRFGLREDVDGAKFSGALSGCDIDIAANKARHRNFAVFHGQLA
jgi:hypothetical protein